MIREEIIDNILQLIYHLWNLSTMSLKWVWNQSCHYILNLSFHHLLSKFEIDPSWVSCSQSPTLEIIYHFPNKIILKKHSSNYAISRSQIFGSFLCLPVKIQSLYMGFRTLYNPAPLSLFCLISFHSPSSSRHLTLLADF